MEEKLEQLRVVLGHARSIAVQKESHETEKYSARLEADAKLLEVLGDLLTCVDNHARVITDIREDVEELQDASQEESEVYEQDGKIYEWASGERREDLEEDTAPASDVPFDLYQYLSRNEIPFDISHCENGEWYYTLSATDLEDIING